MVDTTWALSQSPVFELRDTPGAGRGVFARTGLAAGTDILTTSPSLSPIAHIILRQYRREVCAYCFAYDRGTDWKLRLSATALSFCSETCLEAWSRENSDTHRQALQAVESSVQRQQRQNGDRMDLDSEEQLSWGEAAKTEAEIVKIRSRDRPSKQQRKLLESFANVKVEPDILNFLLSGCFMATSSETKLSSLLTLADNPTVYTSASLHSHVQAYLHLLTLLPITLLPHLQTDICHELISRASHNAFSIRPSSDGEHSGEFLGYGVWPEASFFNHSCRPNVHKERRGRQWTFRSNRDIAAGRELCITYLGGDERDLDVRGRRKRLLDEWGFECQCRGCEEEAEDESRADI